MKIDGQLWLVKCEATSQSGGGHESFCVLTDGPAVLPDVEAAYQALNPDVQGGVYAIHSVEAVDAVCGADGAYRCENRSVHDQRRTRLLPVSLFSKRADLPWEAAGGT